MELNDKGYSQIRFLEKFYQKIFRTITTSRDIGGTGNHNKLTANQHIVNDSFKMIIISQVTPLLRLVLKVQHAIYKTFFFSNIDWDVLDSGNLFSNIVGVQRLPGCSIETVRTTESQQQCDYIYST